jgi:hypothetical protein
VKIQIGLRAMDIGDGGKPPAAALPSQLLRAVA